MEFKDDLMSFCDWDPCYLSRIFVIDFNDMSELWNADGISDKDIMDLVEKTGNYCPIIEEISLEDEVLSKAVMQIESE